MKKIKIIKNGPLLVSGNIPLIELIITPTNDGYIYKEGKVYQTNSDYALCRCGYSENKPFCDGMHNTTDFNGKSVASLNSFDSQAITYESANYILKDVEKLCAFARFCHSKKGDVWELMEQVDNSDSESLALKLACDCPAGRLVMIDKNSGKIIENEYPESIVILQDPSRHCSGPLWIRGGILIEDERGNILEKRNRITLCRCGKSDNKPYCDATHVSTYFDDNN